MTSHSCRIECRRKGRDRKGAQRYQCRQCSKTFLEPREDHLDGMYLPMEKGELVLKLLLEGNSVSTVERITEVHQATILKLLVLAGEKCERIMAEKIRNVEVRAWKPTKFGASSDAFALGRRVGVSEADHTRLAKVEDRVDEIRGTISRMRGAWWILGAVIPVVCAVVHFFGSSLFVAIEHRMETARADATARKTGE